MKAASLALVVLGIIVGIFGLVNHFVLNPPINPVAHTSTIIGAVALVLVVLGGLMMFMGGRSANS